MIDPIGQETLQIMRSVNWYNNWLFYMIKNYLKGNILEVGSGIGNFTELLTSKGRVYATDINREYLKVLNKNKGDNVKVGFCDMETGKCDFKKGYFDSIVCMNVLEHIGKDSDALTNMHGYLKPKGRPILLVPAFSFAYGKLDTELGHFRRYGRSELMSKLQKAGFKNINLRYLNSVGIFGWFINAKILKRNLIPRMQLRVFNFLARPILILEEKIKFPFGLSLLAIADKK